MRCIWATVVCFFVVGVPQSIVATQPTQDDAKPSSGVSPATLRRVTGAGNFAHVCPGAGRRQLFSTPAQPLPDVYVSKSVVDLDEGKSTTYTIQLTHAPGMREDGTVRALYLAAASDLRRSR